MVSQQRVYSIDILRGIVIVLMSLGHSRHFFLNYDFAPTNLTYTFPMLFMSRWITNICAPVFVYLAGVSIYLVQTRYGVRGMISKLLIKRGIWLIFLEVTLLTFFWHTHFDVIQLQVIWIIGVVFLFMSVLIYLPVTAGLLISIAIILLHNMFDFLDYTNLTDSWRVPMTFLHRPGDIVLSSGVRLNVLYTVLPYLGIMLLGYGMGSVFYLERGSRRRLLLLLGSLMLLLFFLLRGFNIYGDPEPWAVQERGVFYTVISFLNVNKYPPSLLFLLSTLGPAFILLPLLEGKMNTWLKKFACIGQVAMFFYLIHIPFIRVCAKIYSLIFDQNPPYLIFYLIWLAMLTVLYKASMIYRSFKMSKKQDPRYWWLRYI